MASTWSNLKFELIGTGDQSGTWGTTTNSNLGTAIEQAIGGKADVTMSSASITLSLTDTTALQDARALYLNLTGTPGGAATLNVPAVQKAYIVYNNTTGGFAVTVKVSGQTGVSVPNGKTMVLYDNGTDVVDAITHLSSLTLGSALPITSGGTGSTSTTFVNLATNVTGTLPIANGGTGSSTAVGARTNILPSYAANSLKVLRVNAGETDVEWSTTSSGVTSVTAGTGLSGGTITSTGTIALNTAYGDTINPYAAKTANYVLAAPNGSSGVPTFRALVAADIPTLNQNTTGNAATATALQTARTINGVSFNGTSDITVADSTKLPLAGGTMTGAITFAAGQTFPGTGTVSSVQVSAGTGLSGGGTVTSSGTITLSNAGVTSLTAGTGISVSGSTGAVTIASTASGPNIQTFTSSGTWTKPSGASLVLIRIFGGGGGGGGGLSSYASPGTGGTGGGGGACVNILVRASTLGSSETITIGSGGSAGGPGSGGGNGGNTTFGSIFTAYGGGGGGSAVTGSSGVSGGAGGGFGGAGSSATSGTGSSVGGQVGGLPNSPFYGSSTNVSGNMNASTLGAGGAGSNWYIAEAGSAEYGGGGGGIGNSNYYSTTSGGSSIYGGGGGGAGNGSNGTTSWNSGYSGNGGGAGVSLKGTNQGSTASIGGGGNRAVDDSNGNPGTQNSYWGNGAGGSGGGWGSTGVGGDGGAGATGGGGGGGGGSSKVSTGGSGGAGGSGYAIIISW